MSTLSSNHKNISREDLNRIQKHFNQTLKVDITPEFDVLTLDRTEIYGHVLALFIRLDVHHSLQLSPSQLLDFLIDVSNEYTEAPYHTFYHAADIVTILYYLCQDNSVNSHLCKKDRSLLMVAALCHDMGHPGFTNSFQINTRTELGLRYQGKSILESYSVDLTIQLLKKNHMKVPVHVLEDLILWTDMAYHSDLEQQAIKLASTWNTVNNDTILKEERNCLCRILLHAADISNMARPWLISKQWSDLIVQEFFTQGDAEKSRQLMISPGMDREHCSQKDISLNFAKVIHPYFEVLSTFIPKSCVLLDYLTLNQIYWKHYDCIDHKMIRLHNIETHRLKKLHDKRTKYPTVHYIETQPLN
ncbi:hypothetical protein BDB01DRAFT_851745 [Pilobolus umbonatus]|nr:hypothetical protein BDB01DRAFT_851745 [Pilobolus umbonatus]